MAPGNRPRPPRRRRIAAVLAAAVVLAVAAVATFRPRGVHEAVRTPRAVMGTECRLRAVGDAAAGRLGLAQAEAQLRRVETLMSTWLEASEVSRLNRAPGGEKALLSVETLEVLGQARAVHVRSRGAFDVTCRTARPPTGDRGIRELRPRDCFPIRSTSP